MKAACEPERIDRILMLTRAYWHAHPYLRLAQVIGNLADGCDAYHLEDDVFEARLCEKLRRAE